MTKYFVTGGSGFIGSAVIKQLFLQDIKVSALARSPASADKLKAINPSIEIISGSLEDLETISKAAKNSDGVLHLGFIHDFSNFEKSIKVDRAVINTIGDALEGTNKPFVLTSAVGLYEAGLKAGEELTEDTKVELDPHHFGYGRGMNEALALSLSERGVRATAIRLPPTVHGAEDPNFVARYINLSQKNGFVGYLTANNTWSAVNRDEVAKLYILAAQKGKAGSVYHGVDESVVKLKDLAETISKKLNIPAKGLTPSELSEAYDRFSLFLSMNIPVSSEKTQKELGWKPNGSTLFEDVRELY